MAKRPANPATRLRATLAANLRAERGQRDWTQEQAAERVGLTLQHYQRIEWGRVNVPLDTLARIGAALDVEPGGLLRARLA